jgi:hypothetical protein
MTNRHNEVMPAGTKQRADGPSPEALERAAQTIAAELGKLYPGYHFTVRHPGEPSPPGALTIPLSSIGDQEDSAARSSRDASGERG